MYSFIVVYLGALLQLPYWARGKSTPFGHIPQLPVEEMDFMTLSVIVIIAITLIILGFVTYNRRDILG